MTETSQPTIVICDPGPRSEYFSDDVQAECSRCWAVVHHPPELPAGAQVVCLDCGLEMAAEAGVKDVELLPDAAPVVIGKLEEERVHA